MSAALLVILLYTAVMLAMGLVISRRVRGSGDFFVAGRSLGPGLICATMLASNIGAGSTVGAAGLAYRDGLAAWWWVGSAAAGSIVLALWIGPRIRQVAAAHDLRTVGDYLEFRFDRRVRMANALLLWIGSLAILAGQLIAIAWILNVVVGTAKPIGCAIGGLLVTAYFAAGGLLTSVRVNVVQLLVKVLGFALALPLALASVGGLEALATTTPSSTYWSFWASGPSGVMFLALLAPAFVVSPGLLQKVFGARDDHAVRWGVGINALGLALYAIVPVLMGIVARTRFPDLSATDLALPTLLTALPPVVGTIGLAAVFSAELSAADAVLFMLTTSLAQDLYKRHLAPHADDAAVLRVSRATALAAGVLGTALAMVSPTVIGALSIFYTLLVVSLLVPIVAGLFVPRAGTPEALASMACGVFCVVILQLVTGGKGFWSLTPPLLGLAAAVIGFLLVFVLTPGRRAARTIVRPNPSRH